MGAFKIVELRCLDAAENSIFETLSVYVADEDEEPA